MRRPTRARSLEKPSSSAFSSIFDDPSLAKVFPTRLFSLARLRLTLSLLALLLALFSVAVCVVITLLGVNRRALGVLRSDAQTYALTATETELNFERYLVTQDVRWWTLYTLSSVDAASEVSALAGNIPSCADTVQRAATTWINFQTRRADVIHIQSTTNSSNVNPYISLQLLLEPFWNPDASCSSALRSVDSSDNTYWIILICALVLILVLSVAWQVASAYDSSRTSELMIEKAILDHVLPANISMKIAEAIRNGESVSACTLQLAHVHPMVSVLFADLVEFTPIAAHLPADTLIALLNVIFTQYDRLAAHYSVTKIKTIGDCYMAAGGLVDTARDTEHSAEALFHFAQNIILVTARLVDHYQSLNQSAQGALPSNANSQRASDVPSNDEHGLLDRRKSARAYGASEGNNRFFPDLSLRVGVHTGPLISGIVGVSLFSFDVWGDTVNTASRMESTGKPNHVHISSATKSLLSTSHEFQRCPMTYIKGKGPMVTFLYAVGVMPQCSDTLSTVAQPCLSRLNNLSSAIDLTQFSSPVQALVLPSVMSPTTAPGHPTPFSRKASLFHPVKLCRIASSAFFEDHLQSFFFNPASPVTDLVLDSGHPGVGPCSTTISTSYSNPFDRVRKQLAPPVDPCHSLARNFSSDKYDLESTSHGGSSPRQPDRNDASSEPSSFEMDRSNLSRGRPTPRSLRSHHAAGPCVPPDSPRGQAHLDFLNTRCNSWEGELPDRDGNTDLGTGFSEGLHPARQEGQLNRASSSEIAKGERCRLASCDHIERLSSDLPIHLGLPITSVRLPTSPMILPPPAPNSRRKKQTSANSLCESAGSFTNS
jgi:class 3 adenylate cyclase